MLTMTLIQTEIIIMVLAVIDKMIRIVSTIYEFQKELIIIMKTGNDKK